MNRFSQLWRGDLSLDDAFWNWAVIGGLLVNFATSAAFLFLIMEDRPILAALAGYLPSVPYNVVVLIGVWRSAERYDGDSRYANLARIVTLIGFVLFTVT
jgi:hypothetical protein